jgi:hypothetical protein
MSEQVFAIAAFVTPRNLGNFQTLSPVPRGAHPFPRVTRPKRPPVSVIFPRCVCGEPLAPWDVARLCLTHYREYLRRRKRGESLTAADLRRELVKRHAALAAD